MIKKLIHNLLQLAAVLSDSFSQNCPPRIRPVVKVLIYVGIVLFDCLLIPVIVPYYWVLGVLDRQKPPVITPFMTFEMALDRQSRDPSSHARLHMLRKIHQQLRRYEPATLVKGVQVEPYGTFFWNDARREIVLQGDVIGVVFPVYFARVPVFVEEFVERASFGHTNYAMCNFNETVG